MGGKGEGHMLYRLLDLVRLTSGAELYALITEKSESSIYRLYASDFHLPNVLMISWETPAAANAEAPPLRKEWVLMLATWGRA